jgi:hypothetical protein
MCLRDQLCAAFNIATDRKKFFNCAILLLSFYHEMVSLQMVYDGNPPNDNYAKNLNIHSQDPKQIERVCSRLGFFVQDLTEPFHFYLIRHGEGTHNVANRIMKHAVYDPQLTEEGVEQAERANERLHNVLHGIIPQVAFSSDLQRAIQTSRIVAGIPMSVILPCAHELNYKGSDGNCKDGFGGNENQAWTRREGCDYSMYEAFNQGYMRGRFSGGKCETSMISLAILWMKFGGRPVEWKYVLAPFQARRRNIVTNRIWTGRSKTYKYFV